MPRTLGTFVMTMLGLDMILGLGVFALPGAVVAALGEWTLPALLVGGLLLSVVAAMFSALVWRTGRNGGPYAYLSLAFGPRIAVPLSWAYCLGLAVGTGCYVAVLGQVLSQATWWGFGAGAAQAFAVLYLVVIAGLNLMGLGPGSRAMVLVTLLKVSWLIVLCLLGVLVWSEAPSLWVGSPAARPSEGVILILFLCQGFEMLPLVAGEARSPGKVLTRAMMGCLWLSLLLYGALFSGLCRLQALGHEPTLKALAQRLGTYGPAFVDALAVLSILGLIAGRVLAIPRLIGVLSEDRFLPSFLSKRAGGRDAPTGAVALAFLVAIPFALHSNLESYATFSAMTGSVQFLLCSLCLLWISGKTNPKQSALAVVSALISIGFLLQIPPSGLLGFFLLHAVAFLLYAATQFRKPLQWTERATE